MFFSRTLTGKPVHQIEMASVPGAWRALGNDPQLRLGSFDRPLPAGWYLLSTRVERLAGELVNACLYADYGAGISEATRIPLPLTRSTELQRIPVNFTGAVQALRLDPSEGPCEFRLDSIALRRMSQMETLLRLFWPEVLRARRLGEGWGGILRNAFRAWRRNDLQRQALAAWELRTRGRGNAPDYADWIAVHDVIDEAARGRIAEAVRDMPRNPLISVLMPVYNPPERWLRRAIDSVRAQLYPHWQLCIADDASTAPHVRRVLQEYAAVDPRIVLYWRPRNGHIAEASNSALQLARGEYVALLDHDDELREHALYHFAARIVQDPQLSFLYSDEDKIDANGRRFDPYFKPDWNLELLRSQNYVSHLGVYRTDLVRDLGGFRVGFEGSQDHDLALRCAERLRSAQIAHIPRVLYHWRAVGGSTALAGGEKDYPVEAGRRAVEEHLQRSGESASVEVVHGAHYRVHYAVPTPAPRVSLVIPTRDRLDLVRTCVESILIATRYDNYEIVIVDNQSSDPATLAWLSTVGADPRVRVLPYDAPFNFSLINNFAVDRVDSELVCLLNNDVEVIHPEWLDELVSHAARPGVGAVGAMLYYPDDTIQHAGVILGIGGVAGHAYPRRPRGYAGQMNRARLAQELSCVTAACLMIRRAIYQEVGGLDAALTVAFNDVDFCLRVREAGYRNIWTPFVELYHHESASRGYEDSPEKLARFHREIAYMQQRWGDALTTDPAYNPNLTLVGDPFVLA